MQLFVGSEHLPNLMMHLTNTCHLTRHDTSWKESDAVKLLSELPEVKI